MFLPKIESHSLICVLPKIDLHRRIMTPYAFFFSIKHILAISPSSSISSSISSLSHLLPILKYSTLS
ncbi:hypothetical protein HanRHA438_Chr06g0269701 [Helianthus annuus]|nr:hypothetical protein HanRHA438_Chr06g0269701 [Helianthus annuus]